MTADSKFSEFLGYDQDRSRSAGVDLSQKLIEKVEVSTTGITIHYHVGDLHYHSVFTESQRQAAQVTSHGTTKK